MPTGPTYRIEFRASALKALRKLPRAAQVALGVRIDKLAADPRPHGAIKLVGKHDMYRVRVGNYRIVYSIEDDRLMVYVLDVGDRKDVYEGL
jgi:mRNA interferase RelE/StbE